MGKIKGTLPKFWILHLWRVWYDANKIELLLVFSLMIEDVKLNELYWCFVFNGWPLVLFCPRMMLSHLWRLVVLNFGCFWWYIHDRVHQTSFLSFRSFPIELPSFYPSFPKTRTLFTLTRVALFDTFLELFLSKKVFYNDYNVKESMPIDRYSFVW